MGNPVAAITAFLKIAQSIGQGAPTVTDRLRVLELFRAAAEGLENHYNETPALEDDYEAGIVN